MEYSVDRLVGDPAPPHGGEGPFELWHFSEHLDLELFQPYVPATNAISPSLVRVVDIRHSPLVWFPRECPRGCIRPTSTTSAEEREQLLPASGRLLPTPRGRRRPGVGRGGAGPGVSRHGRLSRGTLRRTPVMRARLRDGGVNGRPARGRTSRRPVSRPASSRDVHPDRDPGRTR